MSEKKTVTLKYPIPAFGDDGNPMLDEEGNEIEIKELTFKRIKAKDLRKIPKELFSKMDEESIHPADLLSFIAASADISSKSMDELDMEDMNDVMEAASPFLPKSL